MHIPILYLWSLYIWWSFSRHWVLKKKWKQLKYIGKRSCFFCFLFVCFCSLTLRYFQPHPSQVEVDEEEDSFSHETYLRFSKDKSPDDFIGINRKTNTIPEISIKNDYLFFSQRTSPKKQRKYFFSFDNVSSLCASAEWTLLIKIGFVTSQGPSLFDLTSVPKKVKLQKTNFFFF